MLQRKRTLIEISEDQSAFVQAVWEAPWWVKELDLRVSERERIESGENLTDATIFAAIKLLRKQYQNQCGLTPPGKPVVLQVNQEQPVVEIIHLPGHFIAIRYVKGHLLAFDSLNQVSLCDLSSFQWFNSVVRFDRAPVQQQQTNNCALFAVMFAHQLCAGRDTPFPTVRERGMRNHLVQCFEQQFISAFP
jgi:hypothetical protein